MAPAQLLGALTFAGLSILLLACFWLKASIDAPTIATFWASIEATGTCSHFARWNVPSLLDALANTALSLVQLEVV